VQKYFKKISLERDFSDFKTILQVLVDTALSGIGPADSREKEAREKKQTSARRHCLQMSRIHTYVNEASFDLWEIRNRVKGTNYTTQKNTELVKYSIKILDDRIIACPPKDFDSNIS
jgi:hypothetical protein